MTTWLPQLERGEAPLYQALADAIERDVFTGVLQPGVRLPTHRDLADALGVNVTTVTRGYGEAERRGLVSGTVGRGTFIAADATTPASLVSFEPHSPGLIEMGLVTPLAHLDPDLGQALKRIARRRDPGAFLRYCDPRGLPEHRKAGAELAGLYGLPATAEEVVVSAGSQHALACVLTGLFRPGDSIATDSLTYPGIKGLAASLGIRLCPVSMDGGGMLPEALDTVCRRREIKGLYAMPQMQNPTARSLPEERRREIAFLARRHDLTIIEDDAYALTIEERPAPLVSHAPERGVFLAGLSKALGAGLRVGFMVAPEPLRLELARSVLNTIWMVPPLNAEIASDWINRGRIEAVLKSKRQESRSRLEIALKILRGQSLTWRETGYYLWWRLPAPWTGRTFEAKAREAGINVFGAEKFAIGDAPAPHALRLSLSGPTDQAELKKGLKILKTLADKGTDET